MWQTNTWRGWRRYALLATLCLSLSTGGRMLAQEAAAEVTAEATAETTPETEGAVVSGAITNGTAGGEVPPGLDVTLLIRSSQGINQGRTTADADGEFRFTDVPVIAGADYVAVATYRDRVFASDFYRNTSGASAFELPITIYELTEDPAVLTITGLVSQISVVGQSMEVQQYFRIKNTSDRLFTSSQQVGSNRYASAVVTLPPGATVISFDNPERYMYSEKDFALMDTSPILPGDDHLMVVIYLLPYDGTTSLVEQQLTYPLDGEVRLLMWPDTITIKSEQIPRQDTETLQDRTYQRYSADLKLNQGDVIRYEVSGQSAPAFSEPASPPSPTISPLSVILWVIAGAALAGAGLLFLRMRPAVALAQAQQIDTLVKQIAELDAQHRAGQLNHDLWHRQRAPLQARLDALLGKESDEGDD